MRKRLLRVLPVFLMIVVIGLSGCGILPGFEKQAIKDTVTEFYDSYNNENYAHLLELLSSDLRAKEGDSRLLSQIKTLRLLSGATTLREIGEPTINGSTATIWVTTQQFLLGNVPRQLTLKRESLNWKVSDFSR